MAPMAFRQQLPPLPPLTARSFQTATPMPAVVKVHSQSPRTQRPSSFESRVQHPQTVSIRGSSPQTPLSETPRRAQTPRLKSMSKQPEADVDTSPGSDTSKGSSNELHAQTAAGVAADIIAANGMRERYVAAHEGLVAKRAKRSVSKCLRSAGSDGNSSTDGSPHESNGEHCGGQAAAGVAAENLAVHVMRERCVAAHDGLVATRTKRSATKCFRAASADGNDPCEVRCRQQKKLQEQIQLHRETQPPFAVDLADSRFENHQNKLLSQGNGYRSGSATARGPRQPSPGSSFFLRNLDLTYGGAGWAGPGSRCTTPTRESLEDKELQKVCDLVGEKVERRFQNPRECFKCVNTQKDGFVTCSEVEAFFRTFNIPDHTADQIFDRLDVDGSGLIEYNTFKNFVEQRIKPKGKSVETTPCSTRAPSTTCSRRSSPTVEDDDNFVSMNSTRPELTREEMRRKLSQAVQLIADKANLRYPSFRELRRAFRWVDLSKDGKVTRAEVMNFFRVFAVPIETAEYLFTVLDAAGSDEINHSDFVDIFGPAMGIGHKEPSHKKQVELPGDRNLEREVNEIMRIMEGHMLKFSHPREALRSLDLSHDGRVTREEMRTFFDRFGVDHQSADHVFNLLVSRDNEHGNYETCRFIDFMQLFDPVMQPSHYAEGGIGQVS